MSTASNYPPGVTGREYAIQGADRTYSEHHECDRGECDFVGTVEVEVYQGSHWWTCPKCGEEHDVTPPDWYEENEDHYRDGGER